MVNRSPVPLHPVSEWEERFPWMMAGITHAGLAGDPFDLRLFGDAPPTRGRERWQALLEATGFQAIAHARQVHGTTVAVHGARPPGVHIAGSPADGHATSEAGVLLAVTVADCVPIYIVEPWRRVVALLHAGWRGISDGIMASGVQTLVERYRRAARTSPCASRPSHLRALLRGWSRGLRGPWPPRPVPSRPGGRTCGPRIAGSSPWGPGQPRDRLGAVHTLRERRPLFAPGGELGTAGRAPGHLLVKTAIGLCERCSFIRRVRNRRGSTFVLCRRSEEDPRYARYPRLPMLRCLGFEPAACHYEGEAER